MRKKLNEGAITKPTDVLLYNMYDVLMDIKVTLDIIAENTAPNNRDKTIEPVINIRKPVATRNMTAKGTVKKPVNYLKKESGD